MEKYNSSEIPKSSRITRLVDHLYAKMPEIESYRAKLITESYKETEDQPIITRRAKAFSHILHNIPIIIRDEELIVGSNSIAPRGCQTFPEFSYQWLEDELDTVATRTADPFYISEQAKADLREVHKYWKGKTTSELATSYMAPEAILAIDHNIFTPGNYFYNGVGHVTVKYEEVLAIGYEGIIAKAQKELDECNVGDGDYAKKSRFLEAVIMSCQAVIDYAHRYAELAEQMAYQCQDPTRKQELLQIASNCTHVPAKGARNFYEACQSFWFVQQLIQMESSGHSISPGRFDQYMYPYYKSDMEAGNLTREFAQELMDCIWVKLNDLNKCRDAASAEGFAGYSLFQNLIVGGILAIFILLFFLRDLRPTLIVACSIPLSVVAAIVAMYFSGVTLNIISLSGLALGVGMLVDNSVVVIENIYSLKSEGVSTRQAAVHGARHVRGAIEATTLTTV